ncbi:hypothetical protein OS493_001501 [Desmophyllum pertusum]|uniref:Uncharacterized protein n=1 Tax=Desmophyllum pertusum TaxID=174260 RepID=A0A9W9ZJX5_9CNID|nr:hypothetical protein OS493_001501 [Desmophyllum pertusum]
MRDHQLVRTQIKAEKESQTCQHYIRYNVNKLQDKATMSAFKLELSNRFAVLESIDEEADINTRWNQFSRCKPLGNLFTDKVVGFSQLYQKDKVM